MAKPIQAHISNPWNSTQAYALAVFCLMLGVALGYLFRGSESPAVQSANAASPAATQPDPEQQKAMLASVAAPLMETLKQNPNDFDAVVKLGNLFYDGQQYQEAIKFYERALKIHSDNADVRTDLGTAYWYIGDADRALSEFQKSLQVRPNHAGTWFNMGIVKWQGKMDPAGAVLAWQELLKRNPDYEGKAKVEELIAKAKQHAKG
jgi:tetratricopeptide (TPR) repeat protein